MLEQICAKIAAGAFEFSHHAADQSILRQITVQEVCEAMEKAEIIEEYPDDKYAPSCLILGFTNSGRALHIQCSHPTRAIIKVITLYQPDPAIWIDNKVRR